VLEELLADEDGAVGAQCQGDGVGGAGVEGDDFAALVHPDGGVEGVFAEGSDDDSCDAGVEAVDDVAEEIVRHWSRRGGFFDFKSYRVGFEEADPDGEHDFAGEVVEDDDGHLGGGVHHEAADAYFDVGLRRFFGLGLGLEAGQMHEGSLRCPGTHFPTHPAKSAIWMGTQRFVSCS